MYLLVFCKAGQIHKYDFFLFLVQFSIHFGIGMQQNMYNMAKTTTTLNRHYVRNSKILKTLVLFFLFFFNPVASTSENDSFDGVIWSCGDHYNLTQTLHDLVHRYSSISSLYSIGNSTQGKNRQLE